MPQPREPTSPGRSHFPGKAEHVIYLHMVGGPSQIDLFDYKPKMDAWYDKDLPDSIRQGQRLTTMTSGQARFPIAPSKYKFAAPRRVRHVAERVAAVHGENGRRPVFHSHACKPTPSTTSRRSR